MINVVSTDTGRNMLLACALVCQDCLFESRVLLLQDINIFSQQTFNSFTAKILGSERVHPWLTSVHNISLGLLDDNMRGTFILEISKYPSNLRTLGWEYIFPVLLFSLHQPSFRLRSANSPASTPQLKLV